MIRLALASAAAVVVVVGAVDAANTPWAVPFGLLAAAFGVLVMRAESRSTR